MARALFDRDEVIDKSIELFWQHGFSASSMQQVVQATGLQPGSIYLAFGNKEGLFREALERYGRKSLAWIRDVLDGAPSIGEGICRIFEENIQASMKQNYCSCFLVKTQLELAAEGNDLHELAAAKLGEVEALFCSYLEKEFEKERSEQRAVSIMFHIFGMRVYGYQPDSADRIRQGLRTGLPWLPWS
ncbi:TetR/AcrR family transcriptional regulator [Pontiella sulfatireligans]|uniref:HTH-type transcriptional repressor ComR n=1 Tax=Pontiella sulfatireligans TaxID=2750658 RepID=A0A6C2UMG0_9BACT|nr:TetR/AcrR family transcriptional regulator [Pontiella sulfatireligans]VGO20461.1 HTH-type transcriptional repressor ComR [Pontiella sulfatireligans]